MRRPTLQFRLPREKISWYMCVFTQRTCKSIIVFLFSPRTFLLCAQHCASAPFHPTSHPIQSGVPHSLPFFQWHSQTIGGKGLARSVVSGQLFSRRGVGVWYDGGQKRATPATDKWPDQQPPPPFLPFPLRHCFYSRLFRSLSLSFSLLWAVKATLSPLPSPSQESSLFFLLLS